MPPEAHGPNRRGLALIIHSAAFEKVHYALATASAAAAVGRPVLLFFAMGATRALGTNDGWRQLRTDDGGTATAADAALDGLGIADFETLLAACVELGVRIMVCEIGLAVEGLARRDLRPDLGLEEGGLATLMLEAGDGNIVFV
jgi:peroxiredoxin family protein